MSFKITHLRNISMFCSCNLHRRDVFRLGGGFAAALAMSRSQSAKAQFPPPAPNGALPARGEFVVRGGTS